MGYYADYLTKHCFKGDVNDLPKKMQLVKESRMADLRRSQAILNDSCNSMSYRFTGAPSSSVLLHQLSDVCRQIDRLEKTSLTGFFLDLFEEERKSLKDYTKNAYNEMEHSITQTQKLSSHGLSSIFYGIVGKKEDAIQKQTEIFNLANAHAEVGKEASEEWERLSVIDRTSILVARWERTGGALLDLTELDKYALATQTEANDQPTQE